MKSCPGICLSVCTDTVFFRFLWLEDTPPILLACISWLKLQWALGRKSVNNYHLRRLWERNAFCQPITQLHNHCLNVQFPGANSTLTYDFTPVACRGSYFLSTLCHLLLAQVQCVPHSHSWEVILVITSTNTSLKCLNRRNVTCLHF